MGIQRDIKWRISWCFCWWFFYGFVQLFYAGINFLPSDYIQKNELLCSHGISFVLYNRRYWWCMSCHCSLYFRQVLHGSADALSPHIRWFCVVHSHIFSCSNELVLIEIKTEMNPMFNPGAAYPEGSLIEILGILVLLLPFIFISSYPSSNTVHLVIPEFLHF